MIAALVDNDQNTARVALVSLWDFLHNVGKIKSTNGATWKPAEVAPQSINLGSRCKRWRWMQKWWT